MKNIVYICLLLFFVGCSQKKAAKVGETAYQIEQNNIFKDASKSFFIIARMPFTFQETR